LSRNKVDIVVAWIHNSFPSNQPSDLDPDPKVSWPVSQLGKVPVESVNRVDTCTTQMRDAVLAAFAR